MKTFELRTAIIFSIAVFCLNTQATAHSVLQEATRLALVGAGEEAVTEYKRYLFFNPDSPAVAIYLSIAEIYKNSGSPLEAQIALQSALSCAPSDSVRDAIRIEYAILEIAQGKYSSAQMELVRIVSFSETRQLRDRAGLFLCIAYVLAGNWTEARNSISSSVALGNEQRIHLDSLLAVAARYCPKSPSAAKWMSTVLPGLGQIYAHDVRSGLNAFAISGLISFMMIHSIIYGYYQQVIITDLALFWRYYSGNRYYASEAAEMYNARHDRALQNKIMEMLSSNK